MGCKRKNILKPWIAVILLSFFSFPLIYNPIHYLFISHHHHVEDSLSSFGTYHTSCNIDDFSYSETVDYQVLDFGCANSLPVDLELSIQILHFETYRRFSFFLRGPPVNV